jgi:DNA-binding NarL/FixJ family response regulator
MARILIVDDHIILRRGLRGVIESRPGWKCCGEADSGEQSIDRAGELLPDAVVMDVSMPGMGGIKATHALHSKFPHVKIVLLTLHKSTELLRAGLSAGAKGYVLKSDGEEQLIAAIEAAIRDEFYVTTEIAPETVLKIMHEVFPASDSPVMRRSAKGAVSQG